MANIESIRSGLIGWIGSLDEAGLLVVHKFRLNMDSTIGHIHAPTGWVPITEIAKRTGRDQGNLARRCKHFWLPLEQACQYIHKGRVTWHVTQEAAEQFCLANPAPMDTATRQEKAIQATDPRNQDMPNDPTSDPSSPIGSDSDDPGATP